MSFTNAIRYLCFHCYDTLCIPVSTGAAHYASGFMYEGETEISTPVCLRYKVEPLAALNAVRCRVDTLPDMALHAVNELR
jgi:hypothetical protein